MPVVTIVSIMPLLWIAADMLCLLCGRRVRFLLAPGIAALVFCALGARVWLQTVVFFSASLLLFIAELAYEYAKEIKNSAQDAEK